MKKIIFILLFIFIFQFSLVSAIGHPDISRPIGENGITISIVNGTLDVIGYTVQNILGTATAIQFKSPNLFINETNGSTGVSVSCTPVIVPNCSDGTNMTIIPNYSFNENYIMDIPFTIQDIENQTNVSSLFCVSQQEYENCLTTRAQYSAGLDACTLAKNTNEGIATNYSTCATLLTTCQVEKANLESQVTSLNTEAEKTKNQKWAVGILGLAAGIFGTLYFKGHIGKPKIRTPEESYNRGQSA